MTDATRLRMGILATLASSGVLVVSSATGCGSDVVGPQSTSGAASGSGGSGTSAGTAAGTGGETVSGTGGGVASSGATGGVGTAAPECTGARGPAYQNCYTLDQLEAMIDNPPSGGDEPPQPDGGPDGGVELTECPQPALVLGGCCEAAKTGPFEQGDLCCYWFCEPSLCCGRPYLVDGAARVAFPARRADWLLPIAVTQPEALDEATRAALAAAWLQDAQMEHASIASFARFTLELLAVGAPAELVADSQRASLDEVEHARMCFAQASRFARAELGPSPLDLGMPGHDSRARPTLASSAAAAVREGCIGETIAALVAREQLASTQDRSAREALARIAADEERHAALAWRFVRWAIERGGTDVLAAVALAFEEGATTALGGRVPELEGIDATSWHRFGRLTADEMRAAIASAIDEVVRPCVRALLG